MFRYGNKPSIALLQTNRTKNIRKHQILGVNYAYRRTVSTIFISILIIENGILLCTPWFICFLLRCCMGGRGVEHC